MNKIKIIMPTILVAPILFGCNQNKSTYSFAFHSDYCNLDNKSEYSKKETEPITLNMTLKEGYEYCAVPDDIIVLIGKEEGVKGQHYEYTPIIEAGEKYAKSATLTLTVNANISVTVKLSDSDNNFRIDPKKYDEAIDLNASDIKYVQRAYAQMILSGSIVSANYLEDYTSPTVYSHYDRQIYGTPYEPGEYYIEKNGNNYYEYKRKSISTPWEKKDTQEGDFKKPTDLSFRGIIELNKIDYETIKNYYESDRQAYYLNGTVTDRGQEYDCEIIMSFYNNRLTFFSYSYTNTKYDQLKFGTVSYTYGAITPKLPKVN